jgi:Uma2 family endonuclease
VGAAASAWTVVVIVTSLFLVVDIVADGAPAATMGDGGCAAATTGAGVIGCGAAAGSTCGGAGVAGSCCATGDMNGMGVIDRGMPRTVCCDPPGAVPPGRGGSPPGRGNEGVAIGLPGGPSGDSRGAPGGGRGGNGGGGCGCVGVPPTSVLMRRAGGVGVGPSGPSGARGGTVSALGQSLSARSGFSFFSGPFPSFRSGTPRILHPMAGRNRPMESRARSRGGHDAPGRSPSEKMAAGAARGYCPGMGEAAHALKMTPAEYLAFERASSDRHEYADGEIFAMSGGTREHSLAAQNIARELGNVLLERPCEVHGSDLKIKTRADRYHYADAFVLCGSPIFEDETRDVVENPRLIVEVLSDSTERYDRGDKFASYRTLDTLDDYILVSQTTVLVEHYHRLPDGTWLYRALGPGQQLSLASLGCEIPIDRIYLKVFPAL